MARDKKVRAGTMRFVVLEALGKAAIRADIARAELQSLLALDA